MRTLVFVLCLSLSAAVSAQAAPSPAAAAAAALQSGALAGSGAALQRLTDLRLSVRLARRTAGSWLLGFGAASLIAGGVVAGLGHERRAWLAGGLTTASFGVVNGLLSLGLLDLSGADKQRIMAEQDPSAVARLRESELVAHLHSGQFFAVNAGLDVFYAASGALLCGIAAVRDQPDRWELGAGLALITQALFLQVFDVVNWLQSNERAARYRALQ
jgi:hypothetical protein